MLDCNNCRLINFDNEDGTYELSGSSRMIENAIDGCEWCKFFCEVAKKDEVDMHKDLNLRLLRQERVHSRVWLQIESSDQSWYSELMLCDSSGVEPAPGKDYDEAEGRMLGRRVHEQAESKDCLDLAKDWLTRCREHHGGLCQSRSKSPLPTRLLYIGSQQGAVEQRTEVPDGTQNDDEGRREGQGPHGGKHDDLDAVSKHEAGDQPRDSSHEDHMKQQEEAEDIVRLCDTAGKLGDYVALSYVWGQTITLRCTERNIDKLKEGFPIERLPILMREAITVARSLGFDWIWIDGLCIIQGDEIDWSREASKMAQVYGNSSVTISADLSDDVETDLFWGRAVLTSPELHLQPGVCLQTLTQGWDQITDEPLYRRGWPFQERLLSPRTLHYFTNQIAWECNTTVYLESHRGPLKNPGSHFVKNILSSFFNHSLLTDNKQRSIEMEKDLRLDPINRIGCWNAVVQEVVFKDFTMRSDLLPAVSGLASALQVPEIGQYLAGIWEKYPGITLAWFMRWSQATDDQPYKAPSWSWAWTSGQIVWHNEPFDFEPFDGEVEWREWIKKYSPRIVGHHIQTKAADSKGEVLEGSYIVLEGQCTSVWVLETPDKQFEPWESQNDDPDCKKPNVKAHMDVRVDDIDSQAFFDEMVAAQHESYDPQRIKKYLCIEVYRTKSQLYTLALILDRLSGAENGYRRVGLLAYKDVHATQRAAWGTRTLKLY